MHAMGKGPGVIEGHLNSSQAVLLQPLLVQTSHRVWLPGCTLVWSSLVTPGPVCSTVHARVQVTADASVTSAV
jgi:hypothetical protein